MLMMCCPNPKPLGPTCQLKALFQVTRTNSPSHPISPLISPTLSRIMNMKRAKNGSKKR